MHLVLNQRVIEHVAAIVDCGIGDNIGGASLRVDLDFGNVTAVRKSLRRIAIYLCVQIFCDPAALFHCGGALGESEQRDAPLHADRFKCTVPVGAQYCRYSQS
jgi:hypothetical protein